MFMGLGVGAFTSSVFHVVTHAFFKALLFLGAGSVIHAMHHEQDIRKMGGLKKHLPITHITFFLATLAISGVPPFSGFFSKDEIFAHTFEHNKILWLFGVVVAVFTAFYMFRLYYLTFHGEFRGTKHQLEHLHESPKSMTMPLVVLAILSVVGGFIGLPGEGHLLHHFLAPVFADADVRLLPVEPDFNTELALMAVAVVTAVIAIFVARSKYITNKEIPAPETQKLKPLHNLVYNKYYIDELYENTITKPLNWKSNVYNKFVENEIIDGSVRLVKWSVDGSSNILRQLQTGKTGFYIFCMVLGIIAVLATLMI
jgi:NADH-quinone oxidoreductase subunit L